MKVKSKISRILVFCTIIVGALALFVWFDFQKNIVKAKTDVPTVEKDIREHLPIGSSRGDVDAFLDQRKMEHSYIAQDEMFPNSSHTETALMREVANSGMIRTDILIHFKFDDADSRLISFSVEEIHTGP